MNFFKIRKQFFIWQISNSSRKPSFTFLNENILEEYALVCNCIYSLLNTIFVIKKGWTSYFQIQYLFVREGGGCPCFLIPRKNKLYIECRDKMSFFAFCKFLILRSHFKCSKRNGIPFLLKLNHVIRTFIERLRES